VSLAILTILQPGCAGSGGDGPSVAPRVMDARADEELRKMSNYLAGLSGFTIDADVEYDDYLVDTQKIQLSNRIRMDVARPGRMRGEVEGDVDHKRFWYDGSRVTVLDVLQNHYSELNAPATIDATLTNLREEHGLRLPLAELISSSARDWLMAKVTSAHYVGLHPVDGRDCHHLIFEQPTLNWQVWVDAGDHPFPRKLVVSYTALPNCPQYEATFVRWESTAALSDEEFKPRIPDGAGKIDFRPRENNGPAGSSAQK